MEGFELKFNDKVTNVMVKDGVITIDISDHNGKGRIYAGSVESQEQAKNIWYDFDPIEVGDRFEITVCDAVQMSPPVICEKIVEKSELKLEHFRRFEARLKERGLL